MAYYGMSVYDSTDYEALRASALRIADEMWELSGVELDIVQDEVGDFQVIVDGVQRFTDETFEDAVAWVEKTFEVDL